MKKTVWTAACAGLAGAALIAAGPAPASAAAHTRTSSAAATVTAAGEPVYQGAYISETTCRVAGIAGVASGKWRSFECLPLKLATSILWLLLTE